MKLLVKGNLRRFFSILFSIRKKDLKPAQLWLLSRQYWTSWFSVPIPEDGFDACSSWVKAHGIAPRPHAAQRAPCRHRVAPLGVLLQGQDAQELQAAAKALRIMWKQKAFLTAFWFSWVLALRTNTKVTGRECSYCDTVNKETRIYKHTSPLSVLYVLTLGVLLPHQRPQQALNCFLVRIIALGPNNYVLYSTASIQINRTFLKKSMCLRVALRY